MPKWIVCLLKRDLLQKEGICSRQERAEPFSEGLCCPGKITGSHKSCLYCENEGKYIKCTHSSEEQKCCILSNTALVD